MRLLEETIQKIERLDEGMMEKARERVDNLIKPPKSLGRLEDIAVQLSGITRNLYSVIDQKAIITMAADHGVFEEGISSNPQEVTFAQTLLFQKGLQGVCAISKVSEAKIIAVDIRSKGEIPDDVGASTRKMKNRTDNIEKGTAMTRAEEQKRSACVREKDK